MDNEAPGPTSGGGGDARLIALARAGDETAWTAIVELHWKQVWRVSRTIVRDQGGAEEVAQETFRVVRDRLADDRGGGTLCGWIQSVCRQQALDELRRRARMAREVSIEGSTAPGAGPGGVERALATLDEEEREALLVTEAGTSAAELATAMGVAATTITSRRARARARLVQHLDGSARRGG